MRHFVNFVFCFVETGGKKCKETAVCFVFREKRVLTKNGNPDLVTDSQRGHAVRGVDVYKVGLHGWKVHRARVQGSGMHIVGVHGVNVDYLFQTDPEF